MKKECQNRELWIEKATSLIGLRKLAEKMGYEGMGPYFYLWIFTVFDFVGLSLLLGSFGLGIRRLLGIFAFFSVATFGVWGARYLRENYQTIFKEYDFSTGSKILELKYLYFIGGIGIISSWLVVTIGVLPNPLTGEYVHSTVSFQSIWNYLRISIWVFVYILEATDIVSYFFAMTITIPKKVSKIELDFSDIHRRGGMKDIGSSLLRTAEIYFVILTMVTFYEYLILPESLLRLGIMSTSFILAWVVGVILFFGPSLFIHGYMREAKEKKLNELNEKIRATGKESGGRVEVNPKDREERDEYVFYYLEHEHIINTSEYPIDVSVLQELIFAAIIPVILQLLFSMIA